MRDAASKLPRWQCEYEDVLRHIPETVRKEHPISEYKKSPSKDINTNEGLDVGPKTLTPVVQRP